MKTVEAVKTKQDIERVEVLLRKHRGDLYGDLWRIGVNMSLRISDLLQIKYEDLNLKKRLFETTEGKTGKKRAIRLNETAIKIIQKRRKLYPTDTYLFEVHSNRAKGRPISRVSVARIFKEIGEIIDVPLGTHSMRKSRGWAMHSDGVPIEKISKVLNHSNPAQTMTYLGITQEEVLETYDTYEL